MTRRERLRPTIERIQHQNTIGLRAGHAIGWVVDGVVGFNMLCVKPSNDTEEFQRALVHIQWTMDQAETLRDDALRRPRRP